MEQEQIKYYTQDSMMEEDESDIDDDVSEEFKHIQYTSYVEERAEQLYDELQTYCKDNFIYNFFNITLSDCEKFIDRDFVPHEDHLYKEEEEESNWKLMVL